MNKPNTTELEKILAQAGKHDLEEILPALDNVSFSEYAEQLFNEKQLRKSTVIRDSLLDRNYAYQILQGTKTPGRDKVIQLAVAMSLSVEECNRLLILSRNSPLYAKDQHDAIILFALSKHYTVMEINDMLDEYELPVLG